MTTVQDTSSASALFSSGTGNAARTGSGETQDRFLNLLVAQMKNQDPLNPLDNAQVTSQMAQLSTVQGIEKMNDSLQALAAGMGSNQVAQAAGLIGHGVLVPGNRLGPAEGENAFGFELALPADQVTVNITDAAGRPIRTIGLGSKPSGVNVLAWDGLTESGTAAPSGQYGFTINALQGGQEVGVTALNLGMVSSVSQGSQGVRLNMGGGASVGYADIRQIF
jgi:flagellar basal-body rod modification protein FlgD